MKNPIDAIKARTVRKYRHLIDRRILKNNISLKDTRKGKRCFIVGNGPSIKDQDIVKLKDEYTFVMNAFCLHQQYDQIHPKFYVIFHSEYLKGDEASLKFLKALNDKVHPDTIMILPLKAKRLIEEHVILPNNKKFYIYVKGFMKKEVPGGVDMSKKVPSPMSVSVMCLMVALYMGFDPIYLLGLEHNWLAVAPTAEFPHFSDGQSQQFFHRNPNESYEQNCWTTYLLFRNYRLLKESTSSNIYNLTPDSYLDVFPFGKYEDIISQK